MADSEAMLEPEPSEEGLLGSSRVDLVLAGGRPRWVWRASVISLGRAAQAVGSAIPAFRPGFRGRSDVWQGVGRCHGLFE